MGNHCIDCKFCGQDQRSLGEGCCRENLEYERREAEHWAAQQKADDETLARFGLVSYGTTISKAQVAEFLRKMNENQGSLTPTEALYSDLVWAYIQVPGNDRRLADHAEACTETVRRWAVGLASPHPIIEKTVREFILADRDQFLRDVVCEVGLRDFHQRRQSPKIPELAFEAFLGAAGRVAFIMSRFK